MSRVAVALVVLMSCNRGSPRPDELLASRDREIERLALSAEPDDLAQLLEIAAGTFHWRDNLVDSQRDNETRCRALRGLRSAAALFPPLYVHSQAERYSARFARVEIYAELVSLVDHPPACGAKEEPASAVESIGVMCPIVALRPWFVAEHMERAVKSIDRLTGWAPTEAANRIDLSMAAGDERAFRQMLTQYALTARGQAAEPVIAGLTWLERLASQSGNSRYDVLTKSIADGALGQALVKTLGDGDPKVRLAVLLVLVARPCIASRARLQQLIAEDPDADVRFEAKFALDALDHPK